MSEEETKIIEALRNDAEAPIENTRMTVCLVRHLKVAIGLIEKQQKELQNLQQIEQEHQKENGELRSRVNELEKLEDKIKEKIEQVENESCHLSWSSGEDRDWCVNHLKELLGDDINE